MLEAAHLRPSDAAHTSAPADGSQEIDDFIYLISHDVRSSVRALIELPQWIAEDLEEQGVPIEGSVATSIELLNRHTGRLDRMLVDLLTYSRIGRMQNVNKVNIEGALDDVIDDMEIASSFTVIRQVDSPNLVIGERDILTLLTALLQNAVKHHDLTNGQIIVSTRQHAGGVVLAVADDGPGVPSEHRDRVFATMTTLRPRDEREGSGMGLAHVRKIAQHYGGEAHFDDSPYGKGSQVSVYFPRQAAP